MTMPTKDSIEHDTGPRKGTATDRNGKPADLLNLRERFPLFAECWTCGRQVELRTYMGLWRHTGRDVSGASTGDTGEGQAATRPEPTRPVSP
jgi:hypothetical protein